MLNPVSSFCVFFADMIIPYIFFTSIFAHRVAPVKSICLGTFLAFCVSGLNLLFQNNVTINASATLVMIFLLSCCFQCPMIHRIFHTLILIVVSGATETIVVVLGSLLSGQGFLAYNDDFVLFLLLAVSCKTLYYLCILILTRIMKPQPDTIRLPTSFLIYPSTCVFCHFAFWWVCALPQCPEQIQLVLAVASLCLFLSSILLFVSYSRQVSKDREAMQIRNEWMRFQTEQSYYHILEQQNQNLMIYAHDAKKHLATIQALNQDPTIDQYVQQLSGQLSDYARSCHSGNKLLDVMLHKYTIECDLRGIQFEHDVRTCNLSQVQDVDLVAIVGNLMDNAIAAAEGSAAPQITLATVRRNGYSVIILSNSCDRPPLQSNHSLLSTKQNATAHGFGLKSVSQALKKYQGDFEWEYDNAVHTFTITLMLKE